MLLGTTYSHREIEYLSLDNDKAFEELLSLKFDLIRLCLYWSESEPQKNSYHFSKIEKLLKKCQSAKQSVVLAIGMKAPRWPEYYIPLWRRSKDVSSHLPDLLLFLDHALKKLQSYDCIQYWQVENEPFDPSGTDNRSIPAAVVQEEIQHVRSLDTKRKIIVTVWGNHIKKRGTFSQAEKLGDIVGIDLYFKVPTILNLYQGPQSSLSYYRNRFAASEKPVWIMELQAEPWEKHTKAKLLDNPPSMNPLLLMKNYEKATSLNADAIFLWGYEYWYKRKMRGDERYFKVVESILTLRKVES